MIPTTTLKRLQHALREAEQQAKPATTVEARTAPLSKLRDYARGRQFGERMQYWRGREPKDRDNWGAIRKLAVMDDQVSPALGRITTGILGKDPEWTLREGEDPTTSALLDEPGKGTPEARARAGELQALERLGTTWHKDADLHAALKEALQSALWGGFSSLRVYIPHEYADEVTRGQQPSLEAALEFIHVQAVDALSGGPIRDEHGRTIAHYYRYSVADETEQRLVPHVELHTPEWIQHYRVELTTLTPLGEPVPNPLYDESRRRRPNYLMFTLEREGGPAITPSVIDAQDALNVELTNMRRNSDMGGFRSVITMNAESPVDERGEPAEWTIGPDVVVELRGVATSVDSVHGETTGIATPSVTIIEPVDPTVFLQGADAWKTQILEAFDQGHIISKFQAVSGESKRQSRDDFDKRLVTESGVVSAALAWVIPTVLRFAAYLTSPQEEERVHDLVADPRLYLDVSQGSLELFKELAGVYKDGLVSRETVVEANPAVSDAQAELKRIDAERVEGPEPPERQPRDPPGGGEE